MPADPFDEGSGYWGHGEPPEGNPRHGNTHGHTPSLGKPLRDHDAYGDDAKKGSSDAKHAPERIEKQERGGEGQQEVGNTGERQSKEEQIPWSVAVHESPDERAAQSNDQEMQRDGAADDATPPPELLLERDDEEPKSIEG